VFSKALVAVGRAVTQYGWVMAAVIVGLLIAVAYVATDPRMRAILLQRLWRIPGMGERIKSYQLARMYRTLGTRDRGTTERGGGTGPRPIPTDRCVTGGDVVCVTAPRWPQPDPFSPKPEENNPKERSDGGRPADKKKGFNKEQCVQNYLNDNYGSFVANTLVPGFSGLSYIPGSGTAARRGRAL